MIENLAKASEVIDKAKEITSNFDPDKEIKKGKPDSSIKEYNPDEEIEKEKQGGSYGELEKEGHDHSHVPPEEKHHMPAWEAMEKNTDIKYKQCPAIAMEKEEHKRTASWGPSTDAKLYRDEQAKLIKEGKFRDALQMDIDDIHEKFDDKYDTGIKQMLTYIDKLEEEGRV